MMSERDWSKLGIDFSRFEPQLEAPTLEPAPPKAEGSITTIMHGFRDWWWDQFDTGADAAEYHAESAEAATGLLPLLRNLVWPDFEARAEGTILKLKRVSERHYPKTSIPEEEEAAPP
jgi:hypothetical protein